MRTSAKHVVLDWNGTVLDDLSLAVSSVNQVRRSYGMEAIDREVYRRHFGFPISSFYRTIGFDLDKLPFGEVMRSYLSVFDAKVVECPLQEGVSEFLACMKSRNIGLSILSASFQGTLETTLEKKDLHSYFDHVHGLKDEQAAGKIQQAHLLNAAIGLPAHQVLYIGDTLHDLEVGEAIGWNTCLLSCGHQAEDRITEKASLCARGFLHLREIEKWPGDDNP